FPLSVDGPMARTVADVALLLSVLAGPDPRSPIAIAEPGAPFAQSLERDFKGVRVAWVRDLGLPFEPLVLQTVDAVRGVFEELGCVVEDAEPDLTGADEVFKVWRAWSFEAGLGADLRKHRDRMKETLIWNIEEGAKLTGPELGRAEVRHTELFHRVRVF